MCNTQHINAKDDLEPSTFMPEITPGADVVSVLSDVFQSTTSVYKDLIEIKLFCITNNVFHLISLC